MTTGGDPGLIEGSKRMAGYSHLVGTAIAVCAVDRRRSHPRQRDAFAREQAFAFELERSEFERRVSDARLRLLQAQVEPHFLFNTLANVQALVDSGSPQASKVLTSLIAYLRAAVPRMHSQIDHAGKRSGAGARVPRAHADAHTGPPAVRDPSRSGRGAPAAVRP